jgi:hypothetical protein
VSVSGSDQAFVPGLSAPAAPQNLMATLNTQTTVTLNWSDVLSEDGYTVERRLSAGSYAQIAQLAQNGNTYKDSVGLAADSTYYYRVSAFNLAGSTYSDSVRVINKIIPIATFAYKKIEFGSREVGFDTFDTTSVVANAGAGKLIVTTPTITGPDASQFVILTGGDAYVELNAGATKSLLIRFAPTSIGEKVAYLKIITNDMQQGTPAGTVLDTLKGTGVDTRSPAAPVSPGLLPIGWNNTSTFAVNWQGSHRSFRNSRAVV